MRNECPTGKAAKGYGKSSSKGSPYQKGWKGYNSKGKGKSGHKGKGVYEVSEQEQEQYEWAAEYAEEECTTCLGLPLRQVVKDTPVQPVQLKPKSYAEAMGKVHSKKEKKEPSEQSPVNKQIWETIKQGKAKKILVNMSLDAVVNEPKTLNPLTKEKNKAVYEVKHEGNWERVSVKLDSGAVDWVFTPQTAQAFKLTPTNASASGVNYRAANGTEIKNHGQRIVKGFGEDGNPLHVAAQVADVNSNLGSVARTVEAGSRVVFDEDGSYIQNKRTGKKIHVRNNNGQYEFDIWVPQAKKEVQNAKTSAAKNVQVNNQFSPLQEEGDENEEMDISECVGCGPDLAFIRQE
jgi:hypothetical protein